jgi:[ribosomal protein S5]-alanine N-acetyltransferase
MLTTYKYSLEGQESERLYFRKITQNDFETWLKFCRYPDSLKYIFTPEQLLIEDPFDRCKIWFERIFYRYDNALGGMNALIEKTTNEFVGQCGLLTKTIDDVEEIEIGYSLMPDYRGKGYATEAAKKCKLFAFDNQFGDSVISTIHVENKASAKVAIANGMTLEKTTFCEGMLVDIYRAYK